MIQKYLISLVFCLALLINKASLQSFLNSIISNTTTTHESNDEAQNHSFEIYNRHKTITLYVIDQSSKPTRLPWQEIRHDPMVEDVSNLTISRGNKKSRANITGLMDSEYGSALNDEAFQPDIRGKPSNEDRFNGFDFTGPKDSPYAVMLVEFQGDHEYLGICSGTLVTLEWVITAASACFSMAKVTDIEIHAGGYSRQEWLDSEFPLGHQMIRCAEYFIHPFHKQHFGWVPYNNIALVKAERKFISTSTVSAIKINTEPWTYRKYKKCKVTGFGKVQYFEEHSGKDYVRKTHHLGMKSPCPCLEEEKSSDTWICARPRMGMGICGGDWGAGLICDGKLTALVSEVINFVDFYDCVVQRHPFYCAQDNTLNVFQNINPCLDWIDELIDLSINDQFDGDRSGTGDDGLKSGLTRFRNSLAVFLSWACFNQMKRVVF